MQVNWKSPLEPTTKGSGARSGVFSLQKLRVPPTKAKTLCDLIKVYGCPPQGKRTSVLEKLLTSFKRLKLDIEEVSAGVPLPIKGDILTVVRNEADKLVKGMK